MFVLHLAFNLSILYYIQLGDQTHQLPPKKRKINVGPTRLNELWGPAMGITSATEPTIAGRLLIMEIYIYGIG